MLRTLSKKGTPQSHPFGYRFTALPGTITRFRVQMVVHAIAAGRQETA
jgi:hypothetical protein